MPEKELSISDNISIDHDTLYYSLNKLSSPAFKVFMFIYSTAQNYGEMGNGFEQCFGSNLEKIMNLSVAEIIDGFVELRAMEWLTGFCVCRSTQGHWGKSNDGELVFRWSMECFDVDGSNNVEEVLPNGPHEDEYIVVGMKIIVPIAPITRQYSGHFRELRPKVIKRDNGKCRTCGAIDDLHVHHLTYENEGNERLEELITLCASCHRRVKSEG